MNDTHLVKINGTLYGIYGTIHPDSESTEKYCNTCKRHTLFVKKIGMKKPYIFRIPIPGKGIETVYWECNTCNRFIYCEDIQNDQKKKSPIYSNNED